MVKNKKELEILLSTIPDFPSPLFHLEQYVCDSSTASELLWLAHMYKDIVQKIVVDLGCGTGILSYGALLLGAKEVICVDIDLEAVKVFKIFLSNKNYENIHLINADIEYLYLINIDTIIMNPPFGVHRKGLDIFFLSKALELKPKSIYTIHKYNPESHKLIHKIVQSYGYIVKNSIVRFMSIKPTYIIHRKHVHRFKVFLYAVSKNGEYL